MKLQVQYLNQKLYPDVGHKLEVMTKWDALFDDERNESDYLVVEKIEEYLETGKTYNIFITIEEVKEG